ncbi:tRNA pseudouridine(13) synthase TruD, partial [Candidatus Bathyarchaeota archaeon]
RDYYGALRRLPLRLRRLFVQAYQAYLFNRFLSARAREGLPLSLPEPGDWVLLLREGCLPEGRPVRADASRLRELRELAREGRAVVSLPLPGHRQALSGGRQGELERAIMEEEGIKPEDFRVRTMPELASPGGLRPALSPILLRGEPGVSEDELGPGLRALRISFRLPRGSYATVFLRELMKPPDPLEAGF